LTLASFAPKHAPAPGPESGWSLRVLGALTLRRNDQPTTRLISRALAALVSRLALFPDRAHPREELIELLWPGVVLPVGRNRLRQLLSTLKTLLEPPGSPRVLDADRIVIRVVPGALECDAVAFERLLRQGHGAEARLLYRGELMPGYYDEWILEERDRLAALFDSLESLPALPRPPLGAAVFAAPGALPHFWTRLFGAEQNAARLLAVLREHRLVTLLGAGGSGKTRLAVETARALQNDGDHHRAGALGAMRFNRVAFVSLVDCTDAGAAIDAIAGACGLSGRDPLQRIASALAGQRTLLVLDNFEQLVGHVDAPLRQMLTDTATLHLLLTSRQRLGLDGEQVFELSGLPVPPSDSRSAERATPAAESSPIEPAVALFVDRVHSVRHDFVLEPRDRPVITQVLRLLAGMPLAIELAASRMRTLELAELLALLSEGETPMLDMLARDGGVQSLAQRHTSMRHVVAWSWRQLTPPLAELMEALATFAEPARIELVAAVAGLDIPATRRLLDQLADNSLLLARPDHAGIRRYVLLQPVREFVAERAEEATALRGRQRWRGWLVEFGRRSTRRRHESLTEIAAELPQVYAALQSAMADDAQREAVELAVALRRHWEIDTRSGLPLSVMEVLEAAQAQLADPGLRSEACVLLAFSRVMGGFVPEAIAFAETALALAPDAARRTHALLRWIQATMVSGADRPALDAPLAEALALAREIGDKEAQGIALRLQLLLAVNRDDDHVRGEALALESQLLWESLGHRRNAYLGLLDRATCWIAQRRYQEAATALAACEQAAREEANVTGFIMASWQLGRVSVRLRRGEDALGAFRRCVQGSWSHSRLAYVADALVLTPVGLLLTGQADGAARLQGFAVAHWQRHFGAFYPDLERDVRFARRLIRRSVGSVRAEALRVEGTGLSLPQAVALALGDLAA
jgi:predicted ATPase